MTSWSHTDLCKRAWNKTWSEEGYAELKDRDLLGKGKGRAETPPLNFQRILSNIAALTQNARYVIWPLNGEKTFTDYYAITFSTYPVGHRTVDLVPDENTIVQSDAVTVAVLGPYRLGSTT